jgi:exopolysaccharide biosynthesis polyprenyl glycosylphosphotransferase
MKRKLYTVASVFADVILVNLAAVLAFVIRFGGDIPRGNFQAYLILAPLIIFISPIFFYIFEFYDREACISRPRILLNAFRSGLGIFISCVIVAYVFRAHLGTGTFPTPVLGLFFVLMIAFTAGWRLVIWYFQVKRMSKIIKPIKRLVILGENQSESPSFSDLVNQSEQNNTQVIRFSEIAQIDKSSDSRKAANTETLRRRSLSSNEVKDGLLFADSEMVTDLPSLVSFIEKEEIRDVLVESEAMSRDMLVQLAYNLAESDIQLSVIPDQYEVLIGAKITTQAGSFPTIQLATDDKAGWYMNFKRVGDVVISLGMLAGMFLLYPIIAILTKLTSKGPVFYKQKRTGLHGRIFDIYKFRSMHQDAEKDTGAVFAQENDPRMTPIGKIMRKIRLDELPNFINVLKGDMSFIGPRPERPEHINNLKAQFPFYIGRLQVRPGITGWAQVNGNYEDIEFKMHYDRYYIENMSLLLDFIIFLKTIPTVIFGRGAR